jgi:hypothetical protein
MRLPTMSDLLTHEQHLVIECHGDGCTKERVRWTPQEAIERLGADTTFVDAPRKLTCPVCKDRAPEKRISVYPCSEDYYDFMYRLGYRSMGRS